MLCCVCKEKEATVHLTQIAGEKMQKVDLCEDCAKQKGVNDPAGFSLADLLLGAAGCARTRDSGKGSTAKRQLIARLEEAIGGSLTGDTQAFSDKLAVGTCHDIDSLLL